MSILRNCAAALIAALPCLNFSATHAAPSGMDAFGMAQCSPGMDIDSVQAFYDYARALGREDDAHPLGGQLFHLQRPLQRDGLEARTLFYADTDMGMLTGVLVDGLHAEELARKYRLQPETRITLLTTLKGYARALPAQDAGRKPGDSVRITARETSAFPGKTLLACEYISAPDLRHMQEASE